MTDEDATADVPPPWHVFPEITPEDVSAHMRQGQAELYFDQAWRPFWSALTPPQRGEYLNRWNATAAWREAMSVFDMDTDYDAEEDARESEEYLAQVQRERATRQKPPLRKRLFKRG